MRNGADIIKEIRKGGCSIEIGEALNDATEAVKLTGKPAEVTIKLTIRPADKKTDEVDQIIMDDKVTAKIPQAVKKSTFFFIDGNNDLVRDNPDRRKSLSDLPVSNRSESKAS